MIYYDQMIISYIMVELCTLRDIVYIELGFYFCVLI